MGSVSDISGGAATTGSGIISSLGIGSGLDVNSIISQLMAVQNQPVTLLQNRYNADQALVSQYGLLQGALSQFQTSLTALSDPSQYQTLSATVTNTAIASATAKSGAASGTYSLNVTNLAQSQTLISAGQASATSTIGTGTISFNFGTISGTATNGQYGAGTTFTNSGVAAKTVTISSANNSLSGIAAAINAANIGVTASIINDGSSAPNRLSLTVNSTGAANSLNISVTGDPALQNLLNQDVTGTQNLTQTSAAQNATFTLNGLAITRSSNTDSTTLSGVTLNLLSVSSSPTTLTVADNSNGATTAINNLVAAYNIVQGVISKDTSYDPTTQTAGPLQGQNAVNGILFRMQAILNGSVPGAPSGLSMLGQVGVTFSSDGTLSVNSEKLQSALASNPVGVTNLFASNGLATDPLISYTDNSSSTQAGSYGVNITQLAMQGSTVGSAAANTTITAGGNDTLNLNLNGNIQTIRLAAGTYTAEQLATALQNAINTNNSYSSGGLTASVSQSGGVLTITSNTYGSNSIASITGGNGATDLFGAAPTSANGLDVAGTINGQAAVGSGQTLTSTEGNASGLSILVSGGSVGNRGTVNYTGGYINSLNTYITSVLGANGPISAAVKSYNLAISDLENSIDRAKAINAQVLTSLQAQYSALDVTLSKLTAMSTSLASQLASLSPSSSSNG